MTRQTKLSMMAGAGLLVLGLLGMFLLFQFREPPVEASSKYQERMLDVRVVSAVPTDHTVTIQGFGEARPSRTVTLSAEVPGRVVDVHRNVQVGSHVNEGDVLLKIDPADYEADVVEAQAEARRREAELAELRANWESDKRRIATMERTRDLARSQFERARTLLAESVGNQLDVDRSEQSYNEAHDQLIRLRNEIITYPLQEKQAAEQVEAGKAALRRAEKNLERTQIVAPFAGLIAAVFTNGTDVSSAKGTLSPGHIAETGAPLFTLVDDSVLEIAAKLDAPEAYRWLRTGNDPNTLEQVECDVRWAEASNETSWRGRLDRIERYDSATRSLTVVVRVPSAGQSAEGPRLRHGMFCDVRIPGKQLRGVFEVPSAAITVDGAVYVSESGRLASRRVQIARAENGHTFINEGLFAGDQLIVTRLVNPMENALLRIESASDGETE